MNNNQAEVEIRKLVSKIDWIRATQSGDAQKEAISQIDNQIVELKKLTGPRHVTGIYG